MKRMIIAMTAVATFTTSSMSYANTCETETKLVNSMTTQLDAIDSQLSWAKTNRNSTAVNGIGTLLFLYANLKGSSGANSSMLRLHLGAGAGITALSGYNVYLAHKDVAFYQELSETLRKSIQDKEAEIRLGLCVSEQVKKSKNEKAKELYTAMVKTNQLLQQDVAQLDAQLGNLGEKSATVVSVGASIMIIGGYGLMNVSRGAGGILGGVAITMIGGIANMATQAANMPSLVMSAKEARALISVVKVEQEKLKSQEALLREILN